MGAAPALAGQEACGGFNCSAHSAEPTPKACRLVIWFFGVLFIGVCITIRGLAVDGRNVSLEVLFGFSGPVPKNLSVKLIARWA